MAEDDQDRTREAEAEREAEIESEMERVDQDPDQVSEGSENLGTQSADSGTSRDEGEPAEGPEGTRESPNEGERRAETDAEADDEE